MLRMGTRQLHPREEIYRWAIERLDEVFGPDRVQVIPRQHYHVITATVSSRPGSRPEELMLRNPTHDLNKAKEKEKALESWIEEVRQRFKVKAS
jgi:hypothetical protein